MEIGPFQDDDGDVPRVPLIPPLFTPRGGSSDSILASPTPRQTMGANAAQVINLGQYQRKRFEVLSSTGGTLTQDAINMLHSIIKNAMLSGRTHACVQTLRVGTQFDYTFRTPPLRDSLRIHDMHTLQPFTEIQTRIRLHQCTKPLFDWLKQQGVHFICTTKMTSTHKTFGEPSFANFCHVEAFFVPEDTDLRDRPGRIFTLWNTVYMSKCLDASMVPHWNERAYAAMRSGAGHFAVCTLYAEADYQENDHIEAMRVDEFLCFEPRNHLTMQLLERPPKWRLDRKFGVMISWVRQLGYQWTLCCGWNIEEERYSNWAYFTVLLDPLERYENY